MTQRTGLPKSLPFLPGNVAQDPTITHFHKAQIFNVSKYNISEANKLGDVEVDQDLRQSLRDGTATAFDATTKLQMPARKEVQNDGIPREPPKWLKHDREVLRFLAFFQEPVHENQDENYRIRKCVVYYHLDDDTLYISEPKVQNAGIPQGVFLKRHKVPKNDGTLDTYSWQDLNLAYNLEIYGRVFRIYDCDEFTRKFYRNNGILLNAPERLPDNPFEHTRLKVNYKVPPHDAGQIKEYIEVKLGGGHPNRNLHRYMANDRKVLSYKIMWNDTSYDGGLKFFTLNFFLSDGTIEVKEIIEQNSGRDPFPMMLKRQKLPIKAIKTHFPGMSLKKEEYYQPEDLKVGSSIDIHGRECVIVDADDFTKAWIRDNLGYDPQPITMPHSGGIQKPQPIPPYNGYGTVEDSMGSVMSLQPKPPRKDVNKMFKCDMHILRFEAKLVSSDADDETRKFMIMFYCGDDTIQVIEICDKNSGRIGGKFMERKKHKHPYNEKQYLNERDFQIGNLIILNGFKFMLVKADDYTLKYMEDNPETFPGASVHAIANRIRKGHNKFPSVKEYAQHLMETIDSNKDGFISPEELKVRLESIDIYLTRHELLTLVRAFDTNGDGKISTEELISSIES